MTISEKSNPKLGFFRGTNFSRSVGATDWRIGLFLPEFGLKTWIFGKGELPPINKPGVTLERFKTIPLPIVETCHLCFLYALKAARLELDVVVCNWGILLAGILLKLFSPRTKLILDVRSVPIVQSREIANIFWKLYFAAILRTKLFDAFSIITQEMLNDLDQRYHLKETMPTIVWESGYDHELFTPTLDGSALREQLGLQNKFMLMFHGSLSSARGLEESIRCVQLLLNEGMADLSLVFIGAGAAQSDLLYLAVELGVEQHVIFLPPAPHDEIPQLIAAADMGLDPLPDYAWWRHQSPLKVYEYLAMGKPVLATDIACHRHISQAVILAPDNTPTSLANGVRQFRSLPLPEQSRLREAAAREVQGHTWRVRAETLANFIKNEILKGASR